MTHDIARVRLARRRIIAAAAVAPFVTLLAAQEASAHGGHGSPAPSPAGSGSPEPAVSAGGSIPAGYAGVDPRTARRVPLWQELGPGNPIFEGDPEFTFEIFNTIVPDGYLLERITSLGTHTGTHISAPAHFVEGGKYLSQLDEGWTLMPLAVVDVARQVRNSGGDFTVGIAELKAWERRYGRFPVKGCVLLNTGFGKKFGTDAYFDDAPGFTGDATAWLYDNRGIRAIGADTFGPDATSDEDFSSTATALAKGGITVENVGPGLGRMRPYGDWVSINGGRPRFSGFQMGVTGFTP